MSRALALCIRRTRMRTRVSLHVFLVMLHTFRVMLHVFRVIMHVFPVMVHVFPVMLQETRPTLHETPATLHASASASASAEYTKPGRTNARCCTLLKQSLDGATRLFGDRQ